MGEKSAKILSITLVSILAGIVSGFVAVLFVKLVALFTGIIAGEIYNLFDTNQWVVLYDVLTWETPDIIWMIIPILILGALISGLLIWKLVPEAAGARKNFRLGASIKDQKIRWHTPFIKGIASILTIGTGGSAGYEWPISQISSGLGALFSNLFKFGKDGRRLAIALGFGAGIGAIFKAPVGGALLSAYLLHLHGKKPIYIIPSLLASFTSYGIYGSFYGYTPFFDISGVNWSFQQFPLFLILGVFIAGIGFLYVKSFYGTRKLFDKFAVKYHIPLYLKPVIGVAILGGIVVLLGYISPETYVAAFGCLGTGYKYAFYTYSGMLPLMVLILLPFLKILATSLTVGSGAPGGIFSPGIFAGAFVGGAVGTALFTLFPEFIPAATIPVFVIAGVIAMFGGLLHAPIIALILVFELTWSPYVFLPALMALIPAYLLLRIMIPKTSGTVIIHTNDVHGRLSDYIGYDGLTAYINDLIDSGNNVLLFDAGDAFEGKIDVDYNKGASAAKLMNKVGYLAMVPGNHEFDFTVENARSLSDTYDIPILSINVLDESTRKPVFKTSDVYNTPDMKIGVFGVTAPKTKTLEATSGVESLVFLEGDDLYKAAQKEVDCLKEKGCTFIVCLSHLGLDESANTTRSSDLASHVKGIDLVLDGHSHTELPEGLKVDSTLIASTGEYLKNIGVVRIKDGNPEASLVSYNDFTEKDPEISKIIHEYKEKVNEKYSVVIGTSVCNLNGERCSCRSQETNLGDLLADAFMWYQAKNGYNAQCSLINGGAIRESIPSGEIPLMNVNSVHPYNNTMVIMKISGQKLLEAFEANTGTAPDLEGGFPQTSGITYTVDTTKKYVPGEINRVTITSINGKPFNARNTYTVAATNYLANGGDKYSNFVGIKYIDLGITADSVLAEYIRDALGGKIGETYAELQGRITIIQ